MKIEILFFALMSLAFWQESKAPAGTVPDSVVVNKASIDKLKQRHKSLQDSLLINLDSAKSSLSQFEVLSKKFDKNRAIQRNTTVVLQRINLVQDSLLNVLTAAKNSPYDTVYILRTLTVEKEAKPATTEPADTERKANFWKKIIRWF